MGSILVLAVGGVVSYVLVLCANGNFVLAVTGGNQFGNFLPLVSAMRKHGEVRALGGVTDGIR